MRPELQSGAVVKPPTVHQAVPDRGNQLVPQCDAGYAAWQRGALVVMNTLPSQVDCKKGAS